nr:MAG: replication initiator protein [Microvirus sp.]
MPCFHPLNAFQSSAIRSANGKREISFQPPKYAAVPIELPCGQCIGCRLERSRQWAIRCVHEASLHKENCFITLTYNDLHAPPDGSLRVRDFQLFMKRLRKKHGAGIRFFHCGEYGENFGRPHYHACIFGFDFADKKHWSTRNGLPLYRSADLEQLWPFGFSSIGTVTFESAAYVARYIMKKINGDAALDHYTQIDYSTGEIHHLKPEYTTMSRRPGIAADWLKKFTSDVYNHDFIVLNQKKLRPPRYYDAQYELVSPDHLKQIKLKRKTDAKKHLDNNTPSRLSVREQVTQARLTKLPRKLK